MNSSLTHRERIEKCLNGEALDSVPVALWRHFPVDDQGSETLAKAIIDFQDTHQFDFIKVTPASSYCIKEWGVQDEWTGNPHGTRDYFKYVIHNPEDWRHLTRLNPNQGQLGMVNRCLEILVKYYKKTTPVIQTIFSPLAQAKNLVGPDQLGIHIRKYPDALHEALSLITENTLHYLDHISKIGIDGIFFAIQHAQYELLSKKEFLGFGKNYDLQVLTGAKELWLNVGHIHGNDIMFDEVLDYPFHVLNWHDQETFPSLKEAQASFDGVVCGGLKQEEMMVLGTPEDIKQAAGNAIKQTEGRKFVLGTGCVLPITAPFGNIRSVVQSTGVNEANG